MTTTNTPGLDAVRAAQQRADARAKATPRLTYPALNKMVRRQRAALTRAVNTKTAEKVASTVRAAVREWNQPGVIWPDDWARWQRALDDVLAWHQHVDIADLA